MSIRADTAKKSELLALPTLGWDEPRGWYDALLIIPARKKHDSGWAHIALIGVVFDKEDGPGDRASHVLAWPDDISMPDNPTYPAIGKSFDIRMDAYYPSGVSRIWSRKYQFSVSSPVSSVDILTRPKERTDA